jgi:hypothetical protein
MENWARSQGCGELASDAELNNLVSQVVHMALGFTETERVCFIASSSEPIYDSAKISFTRLITSGGCVTVTSSFLRKSSPLR